MLVGRIRCVSWLALKPLGRVTRSRVTFTISPDQSQNLLAIRYSGRVSPNETELCAEQVRNALTKVKPGFRVLVGLTDLQSMEVSCAPHITNIMEMCNHNGERRQKGSCLRVAAMTHTERRLDRSPLAMAPRGRRLRSAQCQCRCSVPQAEPCKGPAVASWLCQTPIGLSARDWQQ